MEILSTIITSLALTSSPVPIIVDTQTATACMQDDCYPVLVGKNTPKGTFGLQLSTTHDPLYKGSVLAFKSDSTGTYAIHRVWNGKPSERRNQRLAGVVTERLITNGCVNVSDEVYDLFKQHRVVIIK